MAYDHIEEVEKFNPYHDSRGRFTSASSGGKFYATPGKSKAHDNAIAREKERQSAASNNGGSATDKYLKRIQSADSLDDLDTIIEEAANDDTLSNKEYEALYARALSTAQSW